MKSIDIKNTRGIIAISASFYAEHINKLIKSTKMNYRILGIYVDRQVNNVQTPLKLVIQWHYPEWVGCYTKISY